MKFTLIVLISFCAFAAHAQILPSETEVHLQPEFRGPVIDGIKAILDKALQFIGETVAYIMAKVTEIIETAKEIFAGVVGDALQKAWDIIKKIADIGKTGIVAQVCAKPYENKIAELMEQMQIQSDACTAESQSALQLAVQVVLDVVQQIKGYINDLYATVAECYDDTVIGGTWCVAKKVFFIRDQVKAALDIAERAILETKQAVSDIINNHQQCVATATDAPMKELHNIMGEVQKCIAANQ